MRWFYRRDTAERELDEEMQFHIEARTRENIAAGMAPAEAALTARRGMDGLERHKEACRDVRGFEWFDQTSRVLRHAFRRLAASPGFTAVAMLTLAIGIGASTAVFSLINGILLKPLPYRNPGQLAAITQNVTFSGKRYDRLPVSAGHVREWRKSSRSLESISLVGWQQRYMTGQGSPVPVIQMTVSAEFFKMIGVEPSLGRSFISGEDQSGLDKVVILSQEFWRDRFHSDPNVAGRKLVLNGEPLEVIGVLPTGFASLPMLPHADVWRPYALESSQFHATAEFNHMAIARMRDGVAIPVAVDELSRLSQGLVKAAGSNLDVSVTGASLASTIWGGVSQPLTLLSAAVGAVLLIACLNVANLLLARLLARRHDYAVRASLGAGRGKLIVEMLSEGALLAIGGGVLGAAAASWFVAALPKWQAIDFPRVSSVDIDWRVLLFAAGLSGFAALVASAIPAWRFSAIEPQDALRRGASRSATGGRSAQRLRSFLVGAEVALCLALLVSASLLIRSFDRVMRVDRGFEAAQVVTFSVEFPGDTYSKPHERLAVFRTLLGRLAALPGVSAAGAVSRLPMNSENNVNGVLAEGEAHVPVFEQPMANYRTATPGYFEAAGIALRAGRVFTDAEADRTSVMISQNLASRIWPNQDPIDRRFRRNGDGDWLRVAGVVADVKQTSLEAAAPMMVYRAERGSGGLTVVVKSSLPPTAFARVAREEAGKVDSGMLLSEMRTMDDLVSSTTARRRLQTLLLTLFAGVAALLAGLGIWGVISYSVGQRRNEIGVRIALGARGASVVALVLRQGLRPVVVGALVGVGLAVAATRALSSLLFGIEPLDPASYVGAVGLLTIVAGAACVIPARYAASIDPVQSLRLE